jgi:hypothetical protein
MTSGRERRLAMAVAFVAFAVGAAASSPPEPAAAHPDSDARKSGKGAKLIASDTARNPDPVPFWGEIECADDSRHEWIGTGGDPHMTATGRPQGDDSFRRLHVIDGDDFYGERCELGNNNHEAPTAFYREGRRRITSASLRLPSPGFPLQAYTWQVVMQMKQAWPGANATGTPVIELAAYDGKWVLSQSESPGLSWTERILWQAPAAAGVWTRFSFDVRYSSDARKGFIKLKVDRNGDLDYKDRREHPRKIRTYTLKHEIPGGDEDGIAPGQSLTSHLRAGIYHDPAVVCPEPLGCFIDLDNVQVVRP